MRFIMRHQDINGKYIGDAIGYCHYKGHKGALNLILAKKHKCIAKKCKYLEKWNDEAWQIKSKCYKKNKKNKF